MMWVGPTIVVVNQKSCALLTLMCWTRLPFVSISAAPARDVHPGRGLPTKRNSPKWSVSWHGPSPGKQVGIGGGPTPEAAPAGSADAAKNIRHATTENNLFKLPPGFRWTPLR